MTAKISHDQKKKNNSVSIKPENMSKGGVFINTDHTLPVGTEIKVNLMLPKGEIKRKKKKKGAISFTGEVVRSEDKGLAISFGDSAEKTKKSVSAKLKNMNPLTARELDMLKMISKGHSNKDIAKKKFISIYTVKTHVYNIFKKIKVENRTQASLWYTKYIKKK